MNKTRNYTESICKDYGMTDADLLNKLIERIDKQSDTIRKLTLDIEELEKKHKEKDLEFCRIKDILNIDTEYLGCYPDYNKCKKNELIEIIKTLNKDLLYIDKAVVKGGLV